LIALEGTARNITLEGNREQCPRCGELAELPDGTFNVVGETIEVLSASRLTRARLLRLADILGQARAGDLAPEAAAEAIASEAPALNPLLERFGPKMRMALLALLWAVFQILLAQGVSELRDDSATREEVRRAVEQAVRKTQQAGPYRPPDPPAGNRAVPRSRGKTGGVRGHRHVREIIRIVHMAGDEAVIRGHTFEDCTIMGPAVLVFRDCDLVDPTLRGKLDAILWEVWPDREWVLGAVLVERCRFLQCRFENIGIAGPKSLLAKLRSEIRPTE
jgi:hypothetical protein